MQWKTYRNDCFGTCNSAGNSHVSKSATREDLGEAERIRAIVNLVGNNSVGKLADKVEVRLVTVDEESTVTRSRSWWYNKWCARG